MALGASDHQKDVEKHSAPQDVYSGDSLCKPNKGCNVQKDEVCSYSNSISNDQRGKQHASEPSKASQRREFENQARKLITSKASMEDLISFLRKVPWQIYQGSPSHVRSTVDLSEGSAKSAAYVTFGMYAQGSFLGVTNITKECTWMSRVLTMVLRKANPEHTYTSMTVSWNS